MTTPGIEVVQVSDLDIARLRAMVAADPAAYTVQDLAEIIAGTLNANGSANLDRAAAMFWDREAAKFSRLVDISESGSSRKMGDLYKNAIAMGTVYRNRLLVPPVIPGAAKPGATRVSQIVRP